MNYILQKTKSGFDTLVYKADKEIKIHSAYEPVKEAERNIQGFIKGRASLIIISGLGLGYHARFLKERFPDCTIIALERDRQVIDIVREKYPQNIDGVFVVNKPADLQTIFEQLDHARVRGAAVYCHRPSYSIEPAFYDTFIKDIKDYIASKISDLLTRFEFEEKWIENILKNAHKIYSSVPVKDFFGRFKNIPGVIVSAGPSLRHNVKYLNLIKDRALIVCVDTAFHVLQKYNISPHIVMTLDSQKHSIRHFQGVSDYAPLLLADVVSCPRILDIYKGGRIISTTAKYYNDADGNLKRETTPFWDWVEEYSGMIGDIQSGGSVATSVFDFLLSLGCSEIILIGQDLAYTGREIHSTGTHHNSDWLPRASRFINLETINQNVIRKRKIKYVTAYGGKDKVISDFVLDLYRKWFEDSAAKVAVPVINATEGGSRIANTVEKSIKDIAASKVVCKNPGSILNDIVKKSQPLDPQQLQNAVNTAIENLKAIEAECRNELEQDNPSEEKISGLVTKLNAGKLINPFMRKTNVYIARHDLESKKAAELVISDILNATNKLSKLLLICKSSLENNR